MNQNTPPEQPQENPAEKLNFTNEQKQEIKNLISEAFGPINDLLPVVTAQQQKIKQRLNELDLSTSDPNVSAFLKKALHYDPNKDYTKQ